jgi:hypothetical protein
VFLVAGWLACILYPLLPLHSRAMIGQNIAVFVHSPLVSTMPAPTALAIWYAVGLLLKGTGVRFARVWLALALVTVTAQVHIIEQTPLLRELAGAVTGVVLFALRPRLARVTQWEAWAVLLFMAIGGLWPFHFSGPPRPFAIMPFEELIVFDGPTVLWIMLSQLVAWGAAIWLFSASGMRRFSATAIVAGMVASAQMARIFVPEATPGVTAPVLATIAGYALDALGANESQMAE